MTALKKWDRETFEEAAQDLEEILSTERREREHPFNLPPEADPKEGNITIPYHHHAVLVREVAAWRTAVLGELLKRKIHLPDGTSIFDAVTALMENRGDCRPPDASARR